MSEKAQVNFAVGTNYLQFAFSPANHVGITAGYGAFNTISDDVREKAHLWEIGGGYYYCMPQGNQKVVLDVYGGLGRGTINVEKPSSYPSTNVSKYIIQPGVGYRTKFFEACVNWRLCDVIYSNITYTDPAVRSNVPQDGRQYFFSEPALTIRGGYKAIKLELQLVESIKMSHVSWNTEPDCISVGLYIIIGGYRKIDPTQSSPNK